MTKHQKNLIKFVVKHPEWHSYSDDKLTIETVCATVNLGIIEIDTRYNQMRLKSLIKANDLLSC